MANGRVDVCSSSPARPDTARRGVPKNYRAFSENTALMFSGLAGASSDDLLIPAIERERAPAPVPVSRARAGTGSRWRPRTGRPVWPRPAAPPPDAPRRSADAHRPEHPGARTASPAAPSAARSARPAAPAAHARRGPSASGRRGVPRPPSAHQRPQQGRIRFHVDPSGDLLQLRLQAPTATVPLPPWSPDEFHVDRQRPRRRRRRPSPSRARWRPPGAAASTRASARAGLSDGDPVGWPALAPAATAAAARDRPPAAAGRVRRRHRASRVGGTSLKPRPPYVRIYPGEGPE